MEQMSLECKVSIDVLLFRDDKDQWLSLEQLNEKNWKLTNIFQIREKQTDFLRTVALFEKVE